jgi:hypothetical protein
VATPDIDIWLGLLDAAIAGRPQTEPPPPWDAWLVVSLLIQHERQRWYREIVDTRLKDVDDDHGDVPGVPGWRFEQDETAYCLVGPDGELLEGESFDVDPRDPAAVLINPGFLATRVRSVAGSRLAEGRLWRWRPNLDLVVDGLDGLVASGVIERREGSECFTLAPSLAARSAELIADLARADAELRWRRALADHDDAAQKAAHHTWLVDRLRTSQRSGELLDVALDIVGPARHYELLREQLAGPIEYAAGRAIELLRKRRDLPVCHEVVGFLRRFDPSVHLPFPGYAAIAYALEHGLEVDYVTARFDELAAVEMSRFVGPSLTSRLAILALRFLPEHALMLVRSALRSSTPVCIEEMAALLSALDQRWCQRELVAALAEPEIELKIRNRNRPTLVAALRHSASEFARRRAEVHDIPPTRDPGAIGYTAEEIAYTNADKFMARAVERARPLADELRDRYPDDWSGNGG